MRPINPFRSGRFSALARWSFPCAVLVALIPAVTSSVPNKYARAEVVSRRTLTLAMDSTVAGGHDETTSSRSAYAGLTGVSGRLRVVIGTPDALSQNPKIKPMLAKLNKSGSAPWPTLTTPDGNTLTVVPLVPLESARSAGFGRYRVGNWPSSNPRYAPPPGFIGVTAENQATSLSAHFTIRDFLTHDQGDVWPKVLVLQPTILDKLELIHQELEREGLPSRLHVMSGFRTPQYNAQGVGEGGRATHSRHMYGDAADVFVDANEDGMMDDLNRDGKVSTADARVLLRAAERVEAKYPALVGGLSAYSANSAHGPFVHVDTRGTKARW